MRTSASDADLTDPSLYFNRELSWLDFNDRVLQLAEDPRVPLLERVNFSAIYEDNLDEFFMVRVADLHDQVESKIDARGADGMSAGRHHRADPPAHDRAARAGLCRCFAEEIRPALAEHGIRIISLADANSRGAGGGRAALPEPGLPGAHAAGDRARPALPLHLQHVAQPGVLLRNPEKGEEVAARVKVPKELLRRFLSIGDGGLTFVPLEEVIAANLDDLFPGMEIVHHSLFRVTRDTDYDVSDEADDLLLAVEEEVRRRRFGEVVRLEISPDMEPRLLDQLVEAMNIDAQQVYETPGLIGLDDLTDIYSVQGFRELRYPSWQGVTPPQFQQGSRTHREVDVFAAMRQSDILVHHPYDSFASSVERFVRKAVEDPNVLAIKQTVYRTSADSPLVPGLIEASERGKQAVCLVELKARFDESANIRWARALEEAGVHVVYGIPGLKTHVKCVLVARREGDGVRNYVHIGTGQLQPEDRPHLHRLRPVHGEPGDRRRHRGDVQLPDRLRTAERLPQGAGRAVQPQGGDRRRDRADDRGALARAAGADPDEDELAARPAVHPGALPRLAGGRQGRPQRPWHLRAAARRRRASPRTSGSSRSSAASSSTPGSTPSSAPTRRGSSSAPPT